MAGPAIMPPALGGVGVPGELDQLGAAAPWGTHRTSVGGLRRMHFGIPSAGNAGDAS